MNTKKMTAFCKDCGTPYESLFVELTGFWTNVGRTSCSHCTNTRMGHEMENQSIMEDYYNDLMKEDDENE